MRHLSIVICALIAVDGGILSFTRNPMSEIVRGDTQRNLSTFALEKFREKHHGATSFLSNEKSSQTGIIRNKRKGLPTLFWESTSTSSQALHAQIKREHISRVTSESPHKIKNTRNRVSKAKNKKMPGTFRGDFNSTPYSTRKRKIFKIIKLEILRSSFDIKKKWHSC